MASLTCPDCGTHITWTATGCAACGVTFQEIRCAACKYVGLPDRFGDQRCPKCKKDKFTIVPRSGKDVEDVGAEAFVEDVPLLNDIERSFSKAKSSESAGTQAPMSEKPD